MNERRIRVLQIITKLDVGGAQETAIRMARLLPADRFDTHLAFGPDGRDVENLYADLRDSGVSHSVIPHLVRRISPWSDLRATLEAARLVRSLRPDVVQTHSSKAGVIGRAAARLARAPATIHTVHGWSFREGQSGPVRRFYLLIERLLAPLTTAWIVVSSRDRDIGLGSRIGTSSQYHVIRSGIDLAQWRSPDDLDPPTRPDGVVVVGTVMRLSWPKDAETILLAIQRLERCRLVIVGDGPQWEDVVRQIAVLGLTDRVEMLGSRRDVASLVRTWDCFVLSSLSEGLPRVIIEAMAAGVPVVCTDVGGVREIVEPEVTGWLVPTKDPEAMARAVRAATARTEEVRDVVRQASLRLAEFSEEEMAARLSTLLECLFSSRR